MIELQFLGAVGTVTGSQFLLTAGDRKILVDCGMFQGSPNEVARNRMDFAFDPAGLDAVLLTHAHLDHCGRIPALVKGGFRGPIITTAATADLAEIVFRDAAMLMAEAEARWRRRHPEESVAEGPALVDDKEMVARLRAARPRSTTMTRAALYGIADVEQAIRQFRPTGYGQSVPVADGVTAVFHDAGHILGSAIIVVTLTDPADGEQMTVVFSGDLGRCDTPILANPAEIAHADAVLVESTYGNREHAGQEAAAEELVATIGEVAEGRGVLLVPAFAIGRTQELVWILDDLVRSGRIKHLPLYLDSPMAQHASEIYLRHPEVYDDETAALLRSGESPLMYPGQTFTTEVAASKAIRTQPRPMMVVASSGMLTGGRILHHLKDFLPDPACTLLFIGYQGEGTLGRHLQNGGKTARIDGQEFPVRCRVRSISGFSAHADEHELDDWLANFTRDGRPMKVFVVHGDPDAAEALAARTRDRLGLDAVVPHYRETVRLR